MSWAMRRRLLIFFIFLVVVGGGAFALLAPTIYKAPSCTDFKHNGDESGVDCGGSCVNFCAFQIKTPVILWSRSFPVTESVYNAMAYIENKNDAAVQAFPYEFRMYDAKDILIARANGTALIPPLGRYAVIETGIQTGSATIVRTTFEFSSLVPAWQRIPTNISTLRATTSNLRLDTTGVIPKLTATLTNASVTTPLANTTVAAILYDANDNAVSVSKTVIPRIGTNSSVPVFFTWPRAFSTQVVREELIPMIDVYTTR